MKGRVWYQLAVFTEGEGDMTRILRKPINSEIPRYWEVAPSFPHEVKLTSVLWH